jgi:hypothetical protein
LPHPADYTVNGIELKIIEATAYLKVMRTSLSVDMIAELGAFLLHEEFDIRDALGVEPVLMCQVSVFSIGLAGYQYWK